MDSRWEKIVTLAGDIDRMMSRGQRPEDAAVARLARAVLDFQVGLLGLPVEVRSAPEVHGRR